jgi:RNA polymerase sigma-70 factor (sigma-E family)
MPGFVEQETFEAFAAGAVPSLVRAAYLYTGSQAAAEDLVQDVLEAVYRGWGRVRADPYGYARAALANRAANRRRWQSRHPEVPLPSDLDPPTPSEGDRVDDAELLVGALAKLPARQRAVLVCRFFEDRTVEETARVLGISTGSVKSHTSRAMARLRVELRVGGSPMAHESGGGTHHA